MTLPSFNLDEVLADRAKYIGELPWLSEISVQITTIAPKQKDEGKAVVVTSTPHGLGAGEKVFVSGYGPTIDHFYVVENHPEKAHQKTAFVIDLPLEQRLGPGLLYAPQVFQILHPKHLSMAANIEMQSLELRHLEVLKAISPQNYQKTMLLLLKSINTSEKDGDKLKKEIEQIVSQLGQAEEGEEINPEEIGHIKKIEVEIMLREIEILASMPKGHMNAMANKPGMVDVANQIHKFIDNLIKQADAQAVKQMAPDAKAPESDAKPPKKPPRSRKPPADTETIAKAS